MNDSTRWRARAAALIGMAALALAGCGPPGESAFTGYVEADLVYVSAPFAGDLTAVAVRRGARVDAGAPLFALDTDLEALTRAEAEARLAQAQAQAANLRTGRRPAEIEAIDRQLAQARASLAATGAQLERNADLVRQGFVSASRLDDLQAARDRDAARVEELTAQLAVARLPARSNEIAAAEAAAQAALAAAAEARWREQRKQALAPVAGLVYDVTFRVGERVPANAPVVVLLPDGALKLRFYVPQPLLAQVAVGARVAVACDGCPSGLEAIVQFVSPQAEFTPPVIYSNESRAKLVFLVEARPAAAAVATLKPGQPVQVRLPAP